MLCVRANEGCPFFFWFLVWQAVNNVAVALLGQGKLKEGTQCRNTTRLVIVTECLTDVVQNQHLL